MSEPRTNDRCPSAEQLTRLLTEQLGAGERDAVEEHLDGCASCQATLARLSDGPEVTHWRAWLRDRTPARVPPPLPRGSSTTATLPGGAPARGEGIAWAAPPGYEVLGELGHGGAGVVYKARQVALNRPVALKVLRVGALARQDEVSRFLQEAEAVAALQHPNLVQIHEVGRWNDSPFLALEYVDGGSLAERLGGTPQPARQAAELVETLARAVEHAHERGIVHRDLKPANVLLDAKPPAAIPKITDFGLAKRLQSDAHLTETGAVVGTPSYMAPEQAQGQVKRVGPAADIYALGALLYECLTGRPPFRAETAFDTLLQVVHHEPVPPRGLQPKVPRDLETVCLKCLQKEPKKRYATALELADDLRRFLEGRPVAARPTPAWERAAKWARRRPSQAALLGLAFLVLTVGFPGVTLLWRREALARAETETHRGRAERALYFNRIQLVDHDVQDNELVAAIDLLDKCRPDPGRPDLRGWEYDYLGGLCHADLVPGLVTRFWVQDVACRPGGTAFFSAAGVPPGMRDGSPDPLDPARTPGELREWGLTGSPRAELAGHRAAVWSVAASADGRWVASGDAAGTVCLWQAGAVRPTRTLPPVGGAVRCVRFSPDSRLLAVAGPDAVRLWDVTTFTERRRLPAAGPGVLAFSPDGRLAAACPHAEGGNGVKLWDVAGGEPLSHGIPPGPVEAVAFSPDGQYLALARSRASRVQLWDAAGTALLREVADQGGAVLALAFAPDGRLATGGEDRAVRLWDPGSGELLAAYRGHTAAVRALAFDAAGRRLVSGGKDQVPRVWDATRRPEGVLLLPFGFRGGPDAVGPFAFAADRRHLTVVLTPNEGATVQTWDAATGARETSRPLPCTVRPCWPRTDLSLSADGSLFAARRADGQAVAVWRTTDLAEVLTLPPDPGPTSALALSPDGRLLATATYPPARGPGAPLPPLEVRVWDVGTGQEVGRLTAEGQEVRSLAFRADGRWLAAAVLLDLSQKPADAPALPTHVYVWDLPGRRERFRLTGHLGAVQCLAFSPDGTRLASAGFLDNTVRCWDLKRGEPVFPYLGSLFLTGVAFTPDGRRLASIGYPGQVQLWDAETGTEVLTLHGFGGRGGGEVGYTPRVAFNADGTRLAANNWDGSIRVWEALPAP